MNVVILYIAGTNFTLLSCKKHGCIEFFRLEVNSEFVKLVKGRSDHHNKVLVAIDHR